MKPVCVVAWFLAASHGASGAPPVPGGPAPEIVVDRLLPEQPAANASLKALGGKAVVLEFWSTWCWGCVQAIAHLNRLAEQFQGQPIVFLSVTEEEPAEVEQFLSRNPIRGWVGFAPQARLFQHYGVELLPQTFLIDRAGKIAAITVPEKVTAAVLEDLLAGRSIGVPAAETSSTGREAPGIRPLLDIVIRPASDAAMGRGKLTGEAMTLRSILSRVFGFYREDRIEGEPLADGAKYDFSFSLPGAKWEELRPLAQQLACAAFQVKVERVRREKEVLVLTAPEGKSPALAPTSRPGPAITSSRRRGYFKMVNGRTTSIALYLERELHRDVVDETGLTGGYDFELKWDPGSEQSLREALRRQLGIQVEAARRPLEYLVVTRLE